MVGPRRFELLTSCTPCKRATRLRYGPTDRKTPKKIENPRDASSFPSFPSLLPCLASFVATTLPHSLCPVNQQKLLPRLTEPDSSRSSKKPGVTLSGPKPTRPPSPDPSFQAHPTAVAQLATRNLPPNLGGAVRISTESKGLLPPLDLGTHPPFPKKIAA
jgi:hypothetical protein